MLKLRKPLLPEWRWWPAIPLVVLLGLCIASSSLPPPVPQPYKEQPASTSGPQCSTHECRQEANEKALTDYTGLLAWFTGALFVATFFTAGFGAVQILFLVRADKTARISADAAKLAADTSVAAERAYLILEPGSEGPAINRPADNEMSHVFRFAVPYEIKNYGKTPAVIKGIYREAAYSRDSNPHAFKRKIVPFGIEVPVASNGTGKYFATLRIKGADIVHALEGEGRIFLICCIAYDDIFGKETRETAFCLQYSPEQGDFTSVWPDRSLNYRT